VIEVLVLPADRAFSVAEDQSLLEAALAAGWRWPSVCGGQAECGTCAFEVEAGGDLLGAVEAREQARLDMLPIRRARPDRNWRLACQARAAGAGQITVRKLCTPPAA
jgi:ferredoxin